MIHFKKRLRLVEVLLICSVFVFTPLNLFAQNVRIWVSDFDGNQILEEQESINFKSGLGFGSDIIVIDTSTTYQIIDGFGAAITGSSAYLINQVLSEDQRDALMTDLFTDQGIKIDFIRHTIGASDFNLSSYTYNDMPEGETDPSLSSFSIEKDRINLIPVIKQALQKNPGLKIMGSPWSAPAWMKEEHTLNGGWLDTNWYKTYANYLVKYVQAYQNEEIPIYALTLQNEPLHNDTRYPSMRMDAGNQINFLKNDLGPAFSNADLNTKLIVYDHNWDEPNYPIEIFNDPTARQYAAGSAFHGYAPNAGPEAQTVVHEAHPDKEIWFTEISGGGWATNYGSNLEFYMKNIIIGVTRNWGKASLFWNLALDENDGPKNGGCDNCRGVVTINSEDGSITKNEEYVAIGHVSKFVDSGAIRIGSTNNNNVLNVAFKNPDGSIVLVAYNQGTQSTRNMVLRADDKYFTYSIPRNMTVTFKWYPESGGTTSVLEENGEINSFELKGNFPNPFNPTTQIVYHVPYTSDIKLSVYNVSGHKVAELFNGKQTAGEHIIAFNASDLASGVYITKLQAERFTVTQKMLLVK